MLIDDWPFPVNSIAFIEFKSEAIAEKVMEEAQGSEVQGRSIMLDFIGDKSKQGGKAQQGTHFVPLTWSTCGVKAAFVQFRHGPEMMTLSLPIHNDGKSQIVKSWFGPVSKCLYFGQSI